MLMLCSHSPKQHLRNAIVALLMLAQEEGQEEVEDSEDYLFARSTAA